MSNRRAAGVPRSRLWGVVAGACLLAAGVPSALGAPTAAVEPLAPQRLVVRLDDPVSASVEEGIAASVGAAYGGSSRPGVFTVEVPAQRAEEVAGALRQRPDVDLVEPDVRFSATAVPAPVTPNDACFSGCEVTFDGGQTSTSVAQRELVRVGARGAWGVTRGDRDIRVAVLDTDVDADHPDLIGKVDVGRNFSGDDEPDARGHGTAVASLIAAQPDNGGGIAGLGWNTRVLAVRVLASDGSGFASDIAAGIRYAADQAGVRVINLSLAQAADDASKVSQELVDAIEYAQEMGILVVAAAGNADDGDPPRTKPSFPAAFPGVLGVTAVDDGDAIADFAWRGSSWVDLAAPGVGVLTLAPGCNCWSTPSGTSFAAPLVSAAAALVMANHPDLAGEDIADILKRTAEPIPGTGEYFESGLLDVAAAVNYQQAPAAEPDPSAGPPPAEPEAPAPAANRPRSSAPASTEPKPAVRPAKPGLWLAGADGGIFAFGDAGFFGSTGSMRLNRPIVGVAATPSGDGYWLVASDGGIFAFGDAGFFGSTGSMRLNHPIVGMVPAPDAVGYWLVASDGGVFAFGDATFYGSTGGINLSQPIVGLAATTTGRGYWMVAGDGGLFAFGDAPFLGAARTAPGVTAVGLAPTASGDGYWIVAGNGAVAAFGDAPALGTLATPPSFPIVGATAR